MQVEEPFVVRLSHDPVMWWGMCLVFRVEKVLDPFDIKEILVTMLFYGQYVWAIVMCITQRFMHNYVGIFPDGFEIDKF